MPKTKEILIEDDDLSLGPDVAHPLRLRTIVTTIQQKKKPIAIVCAVASVVSLVIAFLIPSTYTATTTLIPPQQNRSIASALLSQLGAASALAAADSAIKDPNDVFIAILQSRSIADALISKYKLQSVYRKKEVEDVRKQLAQQTRIRTGKGGVISVGVDDRDPERAAALANSYVQELYRMNSHIAVTEAGQRRAFFEQRFKMAEEELTEAQESFKTTQQRTGLIQLDAQAKGIVEGATALRAKIAAQEVKIRAMQSYATDENPGLKLARQELAGLKEQLAKAELHERSGTMDVALSQLPTAAMEYATKLRDLKYKEGVYEAVGKQLEIARIDEAKEAPLVQVIDPAVPPSKPSSPNRLAFVVASIMSAFVAVSGWFTVREFLRSARRGELGVRPSISERW